MFSLSYKNDRNQTIDLTNSLLFHLLPPEGLDPPEADIITTKNPYMPGSQYRRSEIANRQIILHFSFKGDAERGRLQLYKYFRSGKAGTLYYSSERQVLINCYVKDISIDRSALPVTGSIVLESPKPYFKALDYIIEDLGYILGNLEFILELPEDGIEFGTLDYNATKTITNTGDVDLGLTIELLANGTVVNPKIFNYDTNEAFILNLTMNKGDYIVITTSVGEKTVTLYKYVNGNLTENNIINYVDPSSKWLNLLVGDNVFSTGAESGDEFLQANIKYRLEYEGV